MQPHAIHDIRYAHDLISFILLLYLYLYMSQSLCQPDSMDTGISSPNLYCRMSAYITSYIYMHMVMKYKIVFLVETGADLCFIWIYEIWSCSFLWTLLHTLFQCQCVLIKMRRQMKKKLDFLRYWSEFIIHHTSLHITWKCATRNGHGPLEKCHAFVRYVSVY